MNNISKSFIDYEKVLSRNFSVKDIRIPYRNVNHWDEKGLLLDSQRKDGQWRKFNFVDCIWIRVITELRNFGVTFPIIKSLKEALTEKIPLHFDIKNDEEIDYYNVLLLLLAETVITRNPLSILLQKNGECFFYNPNQINEYGDLLTEFRKKSHISISLPYLLSQFIIENDISLFRRKDENLPIISVDEFEVLEKIRNFGLSMLSMHNRRDEEITLLSTADDYDKAEVQEQFIIGIFSSDYKKISYQTTDGKLVEFKTRALQLEENKDLDPDTKPTKV